MSSGDAIAAALMADVKNNCPHLFRADLSLGKKHALARAMVFFKLPDIARPRNVVFHGFDGAY